MFLGPSEELGAEIIADAQPETCELVLTAGRGRDPMGRNGVTANPINRAGHAGPNLYRADQPSACSDLVERTAADS